MYLPWGNSSTGDNRYHNSQYLSYMEPYDVTVSGGELHLSTTEQNVYSANGTEFGFTEGMITTNSTFQYEYGYAEIRAQLPTGAGNWPAFWSLSGGWPPESDIMEAWTPNPANTGGNIHQGLYNMDSQWNDVYTSDTLGSSWNTFALQWGPGYQTFYLNGVATKSDTTAIPAEDMYFLLNSGVPNGQSGGYSNSNDNTLNVDYVRVYGYNATATGPQITNGEMSVWGSGFTLSGNDYGGWSMSGTNPRTGPDDLEIAGYGAGQETVTGLSPNTTYTFSAYGYSNTSGSWGYIGVKNFGGTETSTTFSQTSWGLDEVTFTTGATNTSALMYFYNPGPATTFYADAALEVTPTITISPIASQNASSGTLVTVPITVKESGGINTTTITATSSNTATVPNSALTVGGTSSSPTLTLNLAAGQGGNSTITVDATDPYGVTAVQTFVVTAIAAITANGDTAGSGQNDIFRLVRNGANLNLYQDNTTGTPTATYAYSSVGVVNVNGLGGNNQLILDYSGGDPIPVDGLNFNGGTGTNTLVIENMPGNESANLSNGSLVIGPDNISFTNTANLSLDLGTGSNTLLSTTPTLTSTLSLAVDSGSTLTLASSSTLPTNAILGVAGTLNLNNQSESIDQLTGGGTVNTGTAATTLTLGANNGSSTFTGSITGSAALQKIGTGTTTLSGKDTFTGIVYLGAGGTSGGNIDGALRITTAAALAGSTLVDFADNNSAYAIFQLNGSGGGITLPSTLAFIMDATASATAANTIENIAGNNTINGTVNTSVGGNQYAFQSDAGTLTITSPFSLETLGSTRYLNLTGAGNGQWTGLLGNGTGGGTMGVTKSGNGTWSLANTESFTGSTTVNAGTLTLPAGDSLASTTVISSAGATLNVNGTLPAATTLTANGNVNFGPSTNNTLLVRALAGLPIGFAGDVTLANAANHQYRTLLVASGLSFAGPASTLNVNNNDLDLPGASLATISALTGNGYNGGAWTGYGITSGAAAADSTHLTALGVISNNANGTTLYNAGTAGLGKFDGIIPGSNDVLVKYTYYGDANLDGKVDGSDYSLIDAGFASQSLATGWYNGDFNYDNTIDGSDYTLIDNAFNTQGGNLTATAIVATPAAQVAAPRAVPPLFASSPITLGNSDQSSLVIKKVIDGIQLLN